MDIDQVLRVKHIRHARTRKPSAGNGHWPLKDAPAELHLSDMRSKASYGSSWDIITFAEDTWLWSDPSR